MNCPRCGEHVAMNARFCPNCGLTITVSNDEAIDPAQRNQSMPEENVLAESSPTKPVEPWEIPQLRQTQPPLPSQPVVPSPQRPPYQPTVPVTPGNGAARVQTASPAQRSRRRRGGCMRGCLVTLLVLVLLVGAGWVFGVPYVHAFAQEQLGLVLSNAVNQIPPTAALSPPGTLQVSETALNNLIVLNTAPSDPVQHAQMHITPSGVRLDFQVYGFACAVTGVPKLVNGQLVMTNATIEGIVALVISPEELTNVVNMHLAAGQARFRHRIINLALKDHEIDLQVGPPIV